LLAISGGLHLEVPRCLSGDRLLLLPSLGSRFCDLIGLGQNSLLPIRGKPADHLIYGQFCHFESSNKA